MGTETTPEYRTKYALVLLIKEMMSQLDEVASLLSQGSKARLSLHFLKETCSVLQELEPEEKDDYFNMLLTILTRENPPSNAVYDDEFARYSIYAKRRFINRIRYDLFSEAA